MKIRLKLNLIEIIMTSGFIVAIVVVLFASSSILSLKDLEIQSTRVLLKLNTIQAHTRTLLTTNEEVKIIRKTWENSIEEFEKAFDDLQNERGVKLLGKEQAFVLDNARGWWVQLYDLYFLSAFSILDNIINSDLADVIGSNGILKSRYKLEESKESNFTYLGKIYSVENYQELIQEDTDVFIEKLKILLTGVKQQADAYIRLSINVAIGIVALTIILSLVLTFTFSKKVAGRISQVEKAIKSVSKGDFSQKLNIKSGDEFETLSNNYNTMMGDLWEKLDSVLDFMLKIGRSTTEGLDIDKVVELIVESAVENTEADSGAIFLVDGTNNLLKVKAVSGFFPPPYQLEDSIKADISSIEKHFKETPIKIGDTLIGKTVLEAKSIFIKDSKTDERMKYNIDENDNLFISSLMIVPLIVSKRLLGVVALVKKKKENPFTDLDYSHFQSFCDYAALTINNVYSYTDLLEKGEIEREIGIAAKIQNNLLPANLPDIKGASIAVHSQAAKGISGDYYDVFRLDSNKVAIVVCDVAGKGVPAALVMVMIRTIIRLIASPNKDSAHMLTLLNKGIIGRIGIEHFATVGFIVYDEKKKEVIYSNAAHSPLLLYKDKIGKFIEVDTPGLPIGVENNEVYKQKKFLAAKGDLLIFFTDGITEARNIRNEEYSYKTLQNLIKSNIKLSAKKIVEAAQKDMNNFIGQAKQHDDQTLLIMKIG